MFQAKKKPAEMAGFLILPAKGGHLEFRDVVSIAVNPEQGNL